MKLSEFTDKDGKPKWRTSWIEKSTGKRKFKQFRLRSDGTLWIRTQKAVKDAHGAKVASTDTDLLSNWQKLDAQLRSMGHTLDEAAKHALKIWSAKGESSAKEVLDDYVAQRLHAGAQKSTVSGVKGKVRRLLSAIPEAKLMQQPIREITTDQLKDAIKVRSLTLSVKGMEYERRKVRDFFSWCVQEDLVAVSPVPIAKKDTSRLLSAKTSSTVAIFTPIECRELLREAHAYGQSSIMAWVVLGLFCGVRPDSTFRVWRIKDKGVKELYEWKWDALHKALRSKESLLELHDKTGSRTQTLTPEAKVWIEWLISHYGIKNSKSAICGQNWAKTLKAFRSGWRDKHKVTRWPNDVLRHSFGTYRFLACDSLATVSNEMGNSPSVVEAHYYKKGVEPQDAEDFWNLTPKLLEDGYVVDTSKFKQPQAWHKDISHKTS